MTDFLTLAVSPVVSMGNNYSAFLPQYLPWVHSCLSKESTEETAVALIM